MIRSMIYLYDTKHYNTMDVIVNAKHQKWKYNVERNSYLLTGSCIDNKEAAVLTALW